VGVRRYIARRVAAFVATLFFVSGLVFVVVRVLPGDPALVIIGAEGSPEVAARLRESLGLNRPILVQYAEWLLRAARGDLGVSLQYDVPVGRLILSRLPVTLPLTVMAAVLLAATALPLGLYAARLPRHRARHGRERARGARHAHPAQRHDPDRDRRRPPARPAHGGSDHPRVGVRAPRARALGPRRNHRA